ncbi:MAG: hypothetical protein R3321_14630 [Nitrososphaeraceae archaeon]|nr:hypothetical protein [Nitrososphaeraceae archaeon]
MLIIVYKLKTYNHELLFDWQVYENMDQVNEFLQDFGDTFEYYSVYKGELMETTL